MRGFVVNKIISLQYRLGKIIGRTEARWICGVVERGFTTLFGREVYNDKK